MPPAGWYSDTENPGGDRWFDGAVWTDFRKASPVPMPTAARPLVTEPAVLLATPAANPAPSFARQRPTALPAATAPAASLQPVLYAPVPAVCV